MNGLVTVLSPAFVAVRFRRLAEATGVFLASISLRFFFVGPISLLSLKRSGCVTCYLIITFALEVLLALLILLK